MPTSLMMFLVALACAIIAGTVALQSLAAAVFPALLSIGFFVGSAGQDIVEEMRRTAK